MREVQINRVYKHFKGDSYLVEGVGIHSETGERCVIYKALYDDGKTYIRPIDLFTLEVDHTKYPNVEQKYKFELQEIDSKRGKEIKNV